MSGISTKPPSGTRDFLPIEVARRKHVVSVIERVYRRYGFLPLETPAIENLGALLGKYGEEGDQLLYRLLERREALARAVERLWSDGGPGGGAAPSASAVEAALADQGLRYDLTVPLARVVAQYRELPRFFKRYQIQPVWRADRPGRGRFREFYQCDVDVIGTTSLLAEAEVAGAAAEVLCELGFGDFAIRLNHRQLLRALIQHVGIDARLETSALVGLDKLDKIGRDGVLAELDERGIARASSSKLLELLATDEREDLALVERLRRELRDGAGIGALDQLLELRELLAATPAAPFARISPELARGLSYYTGPIFEVTATGLSGSLGGGGRYDDLIGMFGKQPIPAVGFSLGLERILLLMQERGLYPDLGVSPDVLLCWFEIDRPAVLRTAHALRAQGLRVEIYPEPAKLGKQLQYADTPGVKARVAAILGGQELASGTITLKQLASGEQRTAAISQAAAVIGSWSDR